jgi:YbgC/YbaW family acyl-CoA thioester hydrolase
MKQPVFRTTRRIEFADTDMAGIVHFANFFRFMEAAEVEFLRSRGLSVALPWEGKRLGFPRVAASCDYRKPARFEDLLDVAVHIDRIGRKSVTYGFVFSLAKETIAQGQVTSVCCRVEGPNLKPIPIPATLRSRLKSARLESGRGKIRSCRPGKNAFHFVSPKRLAVSRVERWRGRLGAAYL